MSTEPNKIIYSMVGVSKYYDKKAVLKDIYLSYFYGAKIGVIGLNGSGKSSLLRIMAGVDKEINGEAVLSPGYTVGFLEQEPLIDDTRTVREVVEEAVQETFLCAHRWLATYDSRYSFRTWLWTILLNQCSRQAKREARQSRLPASDRAGW